MSITRTFGLGGKRIIAQGLAVNGIVTEVKTCWWIKINTKPVRASAMDGAVFPHIITFTYSVEGKEYTGKRYISWAASCPRKGETVTVFHDGNDPAKYALAV